MSDKEKLIEQYSFKGYSLYSGTISEKEWGDKKNAQDYLDKYYLSEQEYLTDWKPLQGNIFISDKGLPELIFEPDFNLLAIRGGTLFTKEDFENLQKCLVKLGDKNLIIIQNTFGTDSGIPLLRMKYPSDITWGEIMSDNFISSVLFEMFHNEYFVFSESASWGKYSANDYEHPLDIIGFKPEFTGIFIEQFKQSKDEQAEVREWLPSKYKVLIN